MCSSYDYSEGAIKELEQKVRPFFKELNECDFCRYLFSELGIGAE